LGGRDTFYGGAHGDAFVGGYGSDRLFGNGGPDFLVAGTENLDSNTGRDYVQAGPGDDSVSVQDDVGDDLDHAGKGNDRCWKDDGDVADSCEDINP
jgi:Ca2+-binding RTX toxin-like protein